MNNIDEIIKSAFASEYRAPQNINRKLLRCAESKGETKMRKKFKLQKVLVILAVIMCCAAPVYAAVKLLTPSQVAKKAGNNAVAHAFESENAVVVNETQEFEDYSVTLLGLVSGKELGETDAFDDGELRFDRTYCVVAIENADGSAVTDLTEMPRFCVSPFLKGYNPNIVNVMTLNGGYRDMIIDGVFYRILNCENLEAFADSMVYLGVNEGAFPNSSAFVFDGATGAIGRAADFKGVNALFELPLDASKADAAKAEAIISDIIR